MEAEEKTFDLTFQAGEQEWTSHLRAMTRPRAIMLARDELIAAAGERAGRFISVAVFDGDEPLGAWDLDPEVGAPVWSPED